MEKVDLVKGDTVARNVDALAALFPHVVTEAADAAGRVVRVVDWDALRQELAGRVVEGPHERYRLDWPGKRAAVLAASAPSAMTLRPDRGESVDFDSTRNLFVEGDNLEVLKLLQESLLGKVAMIYIDPPYNTGNDFLYADDFSTSVADYLAESAQADGAGARLVATGETGGRYHSRWLSMMLPRLKIARALLRDDGVGFVSIDANEVAQLRLLLTELYGAGNVFATITWVSNLKGRQIGYGGPAGTHEYVLCFARDASAVQRFVGSRSELRALMPSVYKGADYEIKRDAKGPYVTKNELFNTNSKFNEKTARTMVFRIHVNPETGDVKVSDIDDRTAFPGYLTVMPHRNAQPGLDWHAWRWSRAKVLAEYDDLEFDVRGDEVKVRTKVRDVDGATLKDLVIGPSTTTGQADLKALGLDKIFDTPKPVSLIQTLVSVATTGDDDIVLDFFAGSATTAEAVIRQNAKDGGTRRFVMVQLDEPCAPGTPAASAGLGTIGAIGRERIRRAGAGVDSTVDAGFRALTLDSSSRRDVLRVPDDTTQDALLDLESTFKADRTPEDLLFDVLLDQGVDLASPIVREQVGDHEIHVVGDATLIACLSAAVGPDVVRAIAAREPRRAVFLDSAFATDAARINAEQVFAEVSPSTDLMVL